MGKRKGPRPPKPEGVESNSRNKTQSKGVSKAERDRALKQLMHGIPSGTDLGTLLFTLLDQHRGAFAGLGVLDPVMPAADRHAAIVGAAAIEHGLKKTIGLHLAEDADFEAVFETYPSAPLSSFADRTSMARALGIVDEATVADLVIIRRIRNIFAHSVHQVSFQHAELRALVGELKKLHDPIWDLFNGEYTQARERYIVTCAIYYVALSQYTFRRPTPSELAMAYALSLQPSPEKPPLPSPPQTPSADRAS